MDGAESGGPNVLTPMRGNDRLPGYEGGNILVADLVRGQRENKHAKAEGRRKHTLWPGIRYHSYAHATVGQDATNIAAD